MLYNLAFLLLTYCIIIYIYTYKKWETPFTVTLHMQHQMNSEAVIRYKGKILFISVILNIFLTNILYIL